MLSNNKSQDPKKYICVNMATTTTGESKLR